MKKYFICILSVCLCLCMFISPVFADEVSADKIKIGVLKFQSNAFDLGAEQAAIVGDIFSKRLARIEPFSVTGYGQLEALAEGHKLSMQGYIPEETAAEFGRLADCKYIIIGTVTGMAAAKQKTISLPNLPKEVAFLSNFLTSKGKASIAADISIVDVETEKTILALSESAEASQAGGASEENVMGGKGGGSGNSALSDLMFKMSLKIREVITGEYAKVTEAGKKTITIDAGTLIGARKGTLCRVYTTDSQGKEENVAVVRIREAGTNYSTAIIADKKSGKFSLIRKGDRVSPISSSDLKSIRKQKFLRTRPQEEVDLNTDNTNEIDSRFNALISPDR